MANPVIRTPDAHPPAEASGWTQKYKANTVSVLDLFNRLMKSSALRNTYRLKLDVTRKVVLVVCLILYLICVDLKRSEDAFVMMVHSGEWETLRTASTNASVFEELKSPSWWRKLDAVIRLMKPISNAIHRLEGDKPYLSQVLKIWDDLVAHAKNWVSELGHPGGLDKVDASFVRGVLRIFKDRAVKHCQPVMAAARLLDPINFFDMGC